MKVKELIKVLESLPQDYDVILSKDGEGNGFSPLPSEDYCYSIGMYISESTWAGEFWNEDHMQDPENVECFQDYHDDDFESNAVVLWPTN